MQRNRLFFIVSLIIIIVISWADIKFLGFEKTYNLSPKVRQAGHYAILFTTALIGYLNWQKKEKWLRVLWLVLYAAVLMFIISISLAYSLSGNHLAIRWKIIMAEVRLVFLGPVPFVVFYLLSNLVHRMTEAAKPGSDE